MFKKITLLTFTLTLLFSLNLMADNYDTKDKMKDKMQAKMNSLKAEHVSVEGTLVCLGCDLKQTEGANAACKVYGHRYALKTRDGQYINFLENQYSEDLVKGEKYHNKEIKVHGIYYANADLLEVESFDVDGKEMTWCGHCSAMDACAAKK
ncbi:MAG: hypothetical protein JXA92_01845 [candidate division Zixibacteria bacterium]|nr:hypothetical protein [candidate division Zixibacteria bacterium]